VVRRLAEELAQRPFGLAVQRPDDLRTVDIIEAHVELLASARDICVFPVPGGPCRMIPRGAWIPSCR